SSGRQDRPSEISGARRASPRLARGGAESAAGGHDAWHRGFNAGLGWSVCSMIVFLYRGKILFTPRRLSRLPRNGVERGDGRAEQSFSTLAHFAHFTSSSARVGPRCCLFIAISSLPLGDSSRGRRQSGPCGFLPCVPSGHGLGFPPRSQSSPAGGA